MLVQNMKDHLILHQSQNLHQQILHQILFTSVLLSNCSTSGFDIYPHCENLCVETQSQKLHQQIIVLVSIYLYIQFKWFFSTIGLLFELKRLMCLPLVYSCMLYIKAMPKVVQLLALVQNQAFAHIHLIFFVLVDQHLEKPLGCSQEFYVEESVTDLSKSFFNFVVTSNI